MFLFGGWGSYYKEAMLYYLYMMADGEITYSEEKIFEEICRDLKIDDEEKNSLIEEIKEFVTDKTDIFDAISGEQLQSGIRFIMKNESSRARVVWNLVNLGYADSFYSDSEKKIVQYLIDKFSVSTDIYQEFIDTADTMLALTKKKAWIASVFPQGSIRDKKEKEVDLTVKQLLDDVKLTIQELTM